MAGNRLVPRYAHTDGLTRLAYTRDGKFLLTVGSNQVIRKFQVGSDEEPDSIDNHQDPITGIAVAENYFCTCSEDATVCVYPIDSPTEHTLLARTTLPIRDVAYSVDGNWIAIASDETAVKVVSSTDSSQIFSLRPAKASNKHVTYSPNGNFLAVSSCNGILYFYDTQTRELIKFLTNTIASLEVESEICSKAAWHPKNGTFAVASTDHFVSVISPDDWLPLYKLLPKENHSGVTDISWSSNGMYIAASFKKGGILIWDTQSHEVVVELPYSTVVALAWQPFENVLSFTTNQGILYSCPDVIPKSILKEENDPTKPLTSSKSKNRTSKELDDLFGSDDEQSQNVNDLDGNSANEENELINHDGLDSSLDLDGDSYMVDENDLNLAKKRKQKALIDRTTTIENGSSKRRLLQASIHKPVHTGSTPWQGNRRYLCLNLVGFIWTVQQDAEHNTITVEFHDETTHRKYHFVDDQKFEMACLDHEGALYASAATESSPGVIYYKAHVDWSRKSEWAMALPMENESPVTISLSSSVVLVCTSAGYVRVFSRQGFPISIHRSKHLPFVACSSFQDTIITIANDGLSSDGNSRLVYSIEDISRDEMLQTGDGVALPPQGTLESVFFSDVGDPYIYDSTGVLLVLMHWRIPGQAKWIPVLDTNELERRKSRQESYWPVTVADNQFHCILLKGASRYPYFPRPMFTEFDFRIPCNTNNPDASTSVPVLEELQLRNKLFLTLLEDSIGDGDVTEDEKISIARLEANIDKALLQLIQKACLEERIERVYELTKTLRRTTSIAAAQKIALHHSLTNVAEKIGNLLSNV